MTRRLRLRDSGTSRAALSAIDAQNRQIYGRVDIVENFASLDGLMPCERLLIDMYLTEGADVLDLGVGGGRTTSALWPMSGTYVGVDYSASMVEAARRRHPHACFEVMDASELSAFADQSFDLALFSFNGLDYLHPVSKRQEAIAELARVVRLGGTVITSSHNSRALVRPVAERPEQPAVRARLVQVVMSARLIVRVLPARAFWTGQGYLRDTASEHTNFTSTPELIAAEFTDHGLRLVQHVGSRYPRNLGGWVEPWYCYAFKRADESARSLHRSSERHPARRR